MPRKNKNADKSGIKRGKKSKGRSVKQAPLSNFDGHPYKRPRPPS